MSTEAQEYKSKQKDKYTTRQVNRCAICGRKRSYIRFFGLCRIHFRQLALRGELPGVVKANT